jgi:hypothetical protein
MISTIEFELDKSCVKGFISWERLKNLIESLNNGEDITHFELTEQGIAFGLRESVGE